MQYRVYERETRVNVFQVDADNEQEACDKVREGKYDKQLDTKGQPPTYDAEEWG